ncbi:MAG: hypothetical protein JEY79_13955 [Pseudodesulfovibrio sp.]|nr:hypothetical protein [Pseudodesulfovibrio sp.]
MAFIDIDFAKPTLCSALGLVEHNLSSSATVKIQAFSDAARTDEVYSKEINLYEPIIGWGESGWGNVGWGGYPDEEDLEFYPRVTQTFFLDESLVYLYWRVSFDNGDDEFFLGRMFLCNHWEASVNLSHGFSLELVDPSNTVESRGGQFWTDVREQYYLAQFDLKAIQDTEIWGRFLNLSKHCGVRKDFIVRLIDLHEKQRAFTTFYGRFTKVPKAQNRTDKLYSSKFIIREVV